MDHQYIEDHDVIDRYLMDKLPLEVRDEFEEHYFECDLCLELLETTADFRQGLQVVAAEAAEVPGTRQAGRLRSLVWLVSGRRAVLLAAAVALLVVLPVTFLLLEMGRTRDQLRRAQLASAQLQRQFEDERQAFQHERRQLEQRVDEQQRQLQAQSQTGQQAGAQATRGLRWLEQPEINTPIFDLIAVRTGGPGSPPVNEIIVPPRSRLMVFSMGLEVVSYETYRAAIWSADNRLMWRGTGLRPSKDDELVISLPADFLPPGHYLLRLEGLTERGEYVAVNEYAFRLKK